MSASAGSDIYVVLVMDRHADPEPTPFMDETEAIEYARAEARSMAWQDDDLDEHLTDSMRSLGWVYFASCSPESDYVYVMRRALQ